MGCYSDLMGLVGYTCWKSDIACWKINHSIGGFSQQSLHVGLGFSSQPCYSCLITRGYLFRYIGDTMHFSVTFTSNKGSQDDITA